MEEYLIKKVRLHDILYNVKSSNYRDNNLRQEAWNEIGGDMNMTPEAVKGLWEKLRRCYLNALNRRLKRSGETTNKTPWKFEAQMSFLLPYLYSRKNRENTTNDGEILEDENINTYDGQENENDEVDDKPEMDTLLENLENNNTHKNEKPVNLQRMRKRKPVERNSLNKIKRENAILRKRKSEEKVETASTVDMDENDMFFMSMSKVTKMLPLVEQAKIKLQLSNIVLSAQIKMEENGHQNKYGA